MTSIDKSSTLVKEIMEEMIVREQSRRSVFEFTNYTMEGFEATGFHETYFKILNSFCERKIKNLIVTVGPQNGKSEGSSRRLPAYILGKYPDTKIALASYSSSFAQRFSADIQRIINDQPFHNLFPDTLLASSEFTDIANRNYSQTQGFFEIVGKKGSLKAIGRGGGLTGNKVDLMVLDDLYKDYSEGNSPIVREAVIAWYLTVVLKRLHNNSQQLIVFTRWHEDDLIGYLENNHTVKTITSWKDLEYFKDNPTHWAKINFPTLKVGEPTEFDPREVGEPIWPSMHSKEGKEEERRLDEEKFESLEQGDPQPKKGLLYSRGFNTYIRRADFRAVKNYTDSADQGSDFLCSICYGVGVDDCIYVLDIVYTQDPHEITEDEVASMLKINRVREADFESNNGGKGFARAVDSILKKRININWYPQMGNKESRVMTNAPVVMSKVLMPHNWTEKWPEFSRDLLRFKRNFKSNAHDDGPDCLTGCMEHSGLLDEDSDALYRK